MTNVHSKIWVHCAQPRPQAQFRLFCFPFAGVGAANFRTWPNYFPAEVEVCTIQLPGRDDRLREKPYSDLPSLVEALAVGVGPSLTMPYAFFGHSMGALIAYELTRAFRRKGLTMPTHLFVSARRAPHLPSSEPPCHQLPNDAFVKTLVSRYNGIPPAVLAEPELMQLFLPILRADFTLLETYRHIAEESIPQPITIFGGLSDQLVSRSELVAWKDLTTGATDVHMMPGGHFFLQTSQAAVLSIVRAAMPC
jgi:medium-chain acyl-[acyl-carrier-protein] hydrolase